MTHGPSTPINISMTPKFKVGSNQRTIGDVANGPDGFIVANLATGDAFIITSGLWASTTLPDIIPLVWTHFGTPTPPDPGDFNFYVNVDTGSDSYDGTTPETAWGTTTPADSQSLSGVQTIAYWYNSAWHLYRKLGITTDEIDLPSELITYTTDQV